MAKPRPEYAATTDSASSEELFHRLLALAHQHERACDITLDS